MSNQPGVLVRDVADSLCIHPFMHSRWRKEVRDGELVGKMAPIDTAAVVELRRLREMEQQYKRLQLEHNLLTKLSGLSRIESRNLCVHRGKPTHVRGPNDVHALPCYTRGVLRLAQSPAKLAGEPGRPPDRTDMPSAPTQPWQLRKSACDAAATAGRRTA